MKFNEQAIDTIAEITGVRREDVYNGSIYPLSKPFSKDLADEKLDEFFQKLTGRLANEENNFDYFRGTFFALMVTGTLDMLNNPAEKMDSRIFAYKWIPIVWDYFSGNPRNFFINGDE